MPIPSRFDTLRALVTDLGLDEDDLGPEVEAQKMLEAMDLNRDGIDAQLDYLLEQYTPTALEALLQRIAESKREDKEDT